MTVGGKGRPNPTVIFLLLAFCLNMFFFYEASQLRHETENLGDALKSMQKRLENTRRSLDRARNSLNQSRLDALEEKTRMENETANLLDEKQEALEENLGLIKEKEELERRLAVSENALAKHAHDQGTKAVSGGAGFDGCRVHVDWTVKAGTSLPRVKVSKERVLNEKSKQECKEKRLMPGDKFDVVVAWINMSEAGYIDWPPLPEGKPHGDGARGRPYKGIGRNRIPNSELIFGLRSMAKWGMMERVNRIYILYDDARQGPPQFLNGLQTKVRPVPHSELMGGTLFIDRVRRFHVVLAYLHHIHGLLDHFLYVNDDMMLTAPFDMGKLYNEKTGMIKQYIGGGGTGNPAAKKGRAYIEKNHGVKWKGADNHCPIFVRTCLMAEMEALWGDDLYKVNDILNLAVETVFSLSVQTMTSPPQLDISTENLFCLVSESLSNPSRT